MRKKGRISVVAKNNRSSYTSASLLDQASVKISKTSGGLQ